MNVSTIVKSKKPMVIEDIAIEPGWVKKDHLTEMHGWLGAPIIINDRVVAIFSLEKKETGFFKQVHADRMVNFCASAAWPSKMPTCLKRYKNEFVSLKASKQPCRILPANWT
jgi:putative methionine-R-sulfoxide reductase with GAF domain